MILSAAFGSQARATADLSAFDDRWYSPSLGLDTDAGIALSADTIHKCAAVLAAVRFKADAVAVCPPKAIEYLGDGSRKPAPNHYAQKLLRNPNAWQTGFQWTNVNVASSTRRATAA
jgi:phage portal protein BeeE